MNDFKDKLEEVNKLIDLPGRNWLFGAGISFNANIPLMVGLTEQVSAALEKIPKMIESYQAIKQQFKNPDDIHIEHILSHIGDLIALIERTEQSQLEINNHIYIKQDFIELYGEIIKEITEIVRYGFCESNGRGRGRGSVANPRVKIDGHLKFVKALFESVNDQAKRSTINFFTTNYDTLLEDALALNEKKVVDGFEGGAIAYWNPMVFGQRKSDEYSVFKLHGSVDWQKDDSNSLYRTRYGTTYLESSSNTMIYPQATKYVETQKDPFAYLFDCFRKVLNESRDSYLGVCGYSFGDEHINSEIDYALKHGGNDLILLVFIEEKEKLPNRLKSWLEDSDINERIYILTEKGIHHEDELVTSLGSSPNFDWWKFEGLTRLLKEGDSFI